MKAVRELKMMVAMRSEQRLNSSAATRGKLVIDVLQNTTAWNVVKREDITTCERYNRGAVQMLMQLASHNEILLNFRGSRFV